jgi:RTA1 like protein
VGGTARSSQRSGSSVREHFIALFSEFYIHHHWGFVDVFDGIMIVLAMYTLNIFHPGIYLPTDDHSPTTSASDSVVMEERLKSTHYQGNAV